MISKIVPDLEAAMAGIQDGAVVLIGGFGGAGQPNALIQGLIAQGAHPRSHRPRRSGTHPCL